MDDNNASENAMELMVKRHLISKSKLATITVTKEGTLFTCVECSAQYDEKEKLELHLFSHFHTYRFLCGVCGTGLKRKEHLDRHMQEHTEYRPHICPQCGKAFKRKEHLNIHSSIHKGNKNLVCSLCNKTFYRKDHLQKHLQTHSKQFVDVNASASSDQEIDIKQEPQEYEEMPIITSVTGNAFSESSMEGDETNSDTPEQTDDIIGTVVLDSTRPFVCTTCGKSYKRKDHLKIHSWTHKKKEVICNDCGKAFHTADQMMVHVNLAHLRSHENTIPGVMQLRALLGDQIDVEVLDEAPLLVPRKKSADDRPHECPVCHRKFKRKQHLKIHANVHFKTAPTANSVWCAACNEGFVDSAAFSSHNCQWASGETCEVEFEPAQWTSGETKKENNPIEFVEVVVDESNEIPEESNIPTPRRVFVCKYCSKPFKRKDHYKIHLHIHTGVKSFFCPDCGKGFYRKDHLQKHMIVHAKLKSKPNKKKEIPDLYPINKLPRADVKPEITIRAPSNSKLRVPLQIKVPYQMVTSTDSGEDQEVTIDPIDNE